MTNKLEVRCNECGGDYFKAIATTTHEVEIDCYGEIIDVLGIIPIDTILYSTPDQFVCIQCGESDVKHLD